MVGIKHGCNQLTYTIESNQTQHKHTQVNQLKDALTMFIIEHVILTKSLYKT